jgi:hypothetical protein
MRTPAGQECPFYYADYHRGRNHQECRLVSPAGPRWQPSDCGRCAVPSILRANACPNLHLEAKIVPGVLGLGRRVALRATCRITPGEVREPEIGCGHCHESSSPSIT